MLELNQKQFESLSLDEKLVWLFREMQMRAEIDNRLSDRLKSTGQLLADVAEQVTKAEPTR